MVQGNGWLVFQWREVGFDGLERVLSAFSGVAAYSRTRLSGALLSVTVFISSSLISQLHGSVSYEWNVLWAMKVRELCVLIDRGFLRVLPPTFHPGVPAADVGVLLYSHRQCRDSIRWPFIRTRKGTQTAARRCCWPMGIRAHRVCCGVE